MKHFLFWFVSIRSFVFFFFISKSACRHAEYDEYHRSRYGRFEKKRKNLLEIHFNLAFFPHRHLLENKRKVISFRNGMKEMERRKNAREKSKIFLFIIDYEPHCVNGPLCVWLMVIYYYLWFSVWLQQEEPFITHQIFHPSMVIATNLLQNFMNFRWLLIVALAIFILIAPCE